METKFCGRHVLVSVGPEKKYSDISTLQNCALSVTEDALAIHVIGSWGNKNYSSSSYKEVKCEMNDTYFSQCNYEFTEE